MLCGLLGRCWLAPYFPTAVASGLPTGARTGFTFGVAGSLVWFQWIVYSVVAW